MKKIKKKFHFHFNYIIIRSLGYTLITSLLVSLLLIVLENFVFNTDIPFKFFGIAINRTFVRILIPSITIGASVGLIVGFIAIKPLRDLSEAAVKISAGDFDVQIKKRKINSNNSTVNKLITNFNLMANKLSNIEELRKDFVSNVSHEFKTPIQTIQGYVTLLNDDTLSEEEKKKYIEIIYDATNNLNDLVSNVLMLSKIEKSDVVANSILFNVSEEIRQAIILAESSWSKKNISFNLDFDDYHIKNDYALLRHVWYNIISNAVKYSYNNSTITINIKKINNNQLQIDFIDEGIGMTEEEKHHIFEKFYQADSSHADHGNGLGLPMVKDILNVCKGKIYIDSEKGVGTTVSIVISNI